MVFFYEKNHIKASIKGTQNSIHNIFLKKEIQHIIHKESFKHI
jgi:hypothetical protein